MLKIFSFHFIYLLWVAAWFRLRQQTMHCRHCLSRFLSLSFAVFVNFLKYVFLFRINCRCSCLLHSFSILRKRIPFSGLCSAFSICLYGDADAGAGAGVAAFQWLERAKIIAMVFYMCSDGFKCSYSTKIQFNRERFHIYDMCVPFSIADLQNFLLSLLETGSLAVDFFSRTHYCVLKTVLNASNLKVFIRKKNNTRKNSEKRRFLSFSYWWKHDNFSMCVFSAITYFDSDKRWKKAAQRSIANAKPKKKKNRSWPISRSYMYICIIFLSFTDAQYSLKKRIW